MIAAARWIWSSEILLGRVSHCDGQGACHLNTLHRGGEEGGEQTAQAEAARFLLFPPVLLGQLRHQHLGWLLHPQSVRVERREGSGGLLVASGAGKDVLHILLLLTLGYEAGQVGGTELLEGVRVAVGQVHRLTESRPQS